MILGWTCAEAIFNICCSLIASLLFLFVVLFIFKPKIRIAPFICKPTDDIPYYFKIVNMSLFIAYDIKVELAEVVKYPIPPGKTNKRQTDLSLVLDNFLYLPPYRPLWFRGTADHAVTFRTTENLIKILSDDQKSIEINISLKHGLTGFSKVYKYEYCDISEIKEGRFAYGTKFATIK